MRIRSLGLVFVMVAASIFLSGCIPRSGGTGSLTGYVSITASKVPGAAIALRPPMEGELPLPMARVLVDGGKRMVLTDRQGRFSVSGLETGYHTIQVSHPDAWNSVNRRVGILDGQVVTARETAPGRAFYLFIGISDYQANIDLQGPENDVDNLVSALDAGRDGRISNTMVLKSAQATKDGIRDAVSVMASSMRYGDYMVLFYSGHGSGTLNTRLFGSKDSIVPHDFSFSKPDSVITDGELADWLGAVPGMRVTVILDSCYSGAFADGTISRGFAAGDTPPPALAPPAPVAGYEGITMKALRDKDGIVLLAASLRDQEAFEVGGYGLYTRALADGLGAERAMADTDRNRIITARELHDYAGLWLRTKQTTSKQEAFMWPMEGEHSQRPILSY